MVYTFTAVYVAGSNGGFVGYVEELCGATAQGATLELAERNLRDATERILEANRQVTRAAFAECRIVHRAPLVVGEPDDAWARHRLARHH